MWVREVSSYTGEPLTTLEYKQTDDTVYVKSVFEKNNWESTSKFTILDADTLVSDTVSDIPGKIIYKRVK